MSFPWLSCEGFAGELASRVAAALVLSVRHHLKVIRENASAVAAAMVELFSWWDRAMLQNVHDDMDGHGATIEAHSRIVFPPS